MTGTTFSTCLFKDRLSIRASSLIRATSRSIKGRRQAATTRSSAAIPRLPNISVGDVFENRVGGIIGGRDMINNRGGNDEFSATSAS